jgi:hypothetical protein
LKQWLLNSRKASLRTVDGGVGWTFRLPVNNVLNGCVRREFELNASPIELMVLRTCAMKLSIGTENAVPYFKYLEKGLIA